MAEQTPREDLHDILVSILGNNNVYFQPPESKKLEYDCIIYKRRSVRINHADNRPYFYQQEYDITYITKNADSEIPRQIGKLPKVSFDRAFTADNLYHEVFRLVYP